MTWASRSDPKKPYAQEGIWGVPFHMKRSARISISLPADLKRRMDAAENINWSQTAAKAFEALLDELAVPVCTEDDADHEAPADLGAVPRVVMKADLSRVSVVRHSILLG